MKRQISANFGNVLLSLSEITDLASPIIAQHQQRTAFIALETAKRLSEESDFLEKIFTASLLHDIGAISVEEKILLHNFEEFDNDIHCIKGELLLQKIPWLKQISKIIRYHHKNWQDWSEDSTLVCLPSQIILLSDYTERLIDRNKYILHQNQEIIEKILQIKNTMVCEKVVDAFIDVAKREEFWLDVVSPRLYPILLHNGPYRNIEIDQQGIFLLSEIFKDIIDFKSPFTATHTTGVSACAEIMSKLYGLTEIEINLIQLAGNLHDLGKLIIPNGILEKPDKLTKDEFAVIKCHTYYSYYVINTIGGLKQIAEWAAYHHERLDGNGYPFHCNSEELDTGARIIAVADIFTALSEDRPYRKRMNKENVYRILKDMVENNALDLKIVNLLFDNYDKIDTFVKSKQETAKKYYENRFFKINKTRKVK
jgi:HD-GYP domain-containing protein (c-di-GMP phosphodiesterase class II)